MAGTTEGGVIREIRRGIVAGSHWIHRETLAVLVVVDTDIAGEVGVLPDKFCGNDDDVWKLWLDIEDLQRDYIADGPLTAEWLEEIGWRKCIAMPAFWVQTKWGVLDLYLSSPRIEFCSHVFGNPTTRHDVLCCMRVFGVEAKGVA